MFIVSVIWSSSQPVDLCSHTSTSKLSIPNPMKHIVQVTQSCLTLCDPMDYVVHGILQARILEWVAFPFSRGSSQPRSSAMQVDSLPAEPQGKPKNTGVDSLSLLQGIFLTQESNQVFCIAGGFLTSWTTKEIPELPKKPNFMIMFSSVAQLCLTLCDPMDCSSPGSSVHGIFQARILEWIAMPSSRGSSQLRDWTPVSYVSFIGRQVLYY